MPEETDQSEDTYTQFSLLLPSKAWETLETMAAMHNCDPRALIIQAVDDRVCLFQWLLEHPVPTEARQ